MKRLIFFTILMILSVFVINAQKINVQKGSVSSVKDQKTFLVTFDYSNMSVGKFDNEEDYLAEKAAKYNEKEAGRGDKWKEAWVADRAGRYEPRFETLFAKYGEKVGMTATRTAPDAKYEINIHTIHTETGFNVGVMRKPAYIDAIITFKNIASGEEVAVLAAYNCLGQDAMGYDFDTGVRLEEAYAKLGKSLANYIMKQK
jgi:hypothetical protein